MVVVVVMAYLGNREGEEDKSNWRWLYMIDDNDREELLVIEDRSVHAVASAYSM